MIKILKSAWPKQFRCACGTKFTAEVDNIEEIERYHYVTIRTPKEKAVKCPDCGDWNFL